MLFKLLQVRCREQKCNSRNGFLGGDLDFKSSPCFDWIRRGTKILTAMILFANGAGDRYSLSCCVY